MDFKITDLSYNKESNRIVLTITKFISESNKPRKGMKSRWSVKYKKSINCNNPKGFSQKAYCARKRDMNLIKSNDPVARYYNMKPGEVVKIIRPSTMTCETFGYRLVIKATHLKAKT
jgi:DNA-directed RNA polymerase subunit H (RpoH/RPB5)